MILKITLREVRKLSFFSKQNTTSAQGNSNSACVGDILILTTVKREAEQRSASDPILHILIGILKQILMRITV